MRYLTIQFWKAVAIIWDVRPRMHLPKFADYPIASTPIAEGGGYDYPPNIKVLYAWNEKGRHWIAFSR